jgi:hypothetical protein
MLENIPPLRQIGYYFSLSVGSTPRYSPSTKISFGTINICIFLDLVIKGSISHEDTFLALEPV